MGETIIGFCVCFTSRGKGDDGKDESSRTKADDQKEREKMKAENPRVL